MKYKTTNYFVPNSSNSICDVTGFKKKNNELLRRWEGWYVVPAAWNPRQMQDYAPYILKTVTYKNTRFESANPSEEAATPPSVV